MLTEESSELAELFKLRGRALPGRAYAGDSKLPGRHGYAGHWQWPSSRDSAMRPRSSKELSKVWIGEVVVHDG
jgi:hypothetical protein